MKAAPKALADPGDAHGDGLAAIHAQTFLSVSSPTVVARAARTAPFLEAEPCLREAGR